jgi:hypothetical protein
MVNVGIYIYTDSIADLSSVFVDNFISRVQADSGTFEAGNCLLTELQNLGGSLGETTQAKRIELFADEKISVTSSIQNINDIGKTYTDFSQTFTVPATKNNNKIFKHWYENSLDTQFSTLIKADAYIELDTIPFRVGKIQLESCDIKENNVQSYSITFIGNLGNLKDKFAGLFLKDLNTTDYNDTYSNQEVRGKVVGNNTSVDIMYPLISSGRYWNYGFGGLDDITVASTPIRYSELFPAVRLKTMFNIIETTFNVNLQGTAENPSYFLTNSKFTNAYLYLKNAEDFIIQDATTKIDFSTKSGFPVNGWDFDLLIDGLTYTTPTTFINSIVTLEVTSTTKNIPYNVLVYKNGLLYTKLPCLNPNLNFNVFNIINYTTDTIDNEGFFEFYIESKNTLLFTSQLKVAVLGLTTAIANQTATPIWTLFLKLTSYMPEIKIEDFFAGVLKMFNLTCYSSDGVNYTIDTLESYYNLGSIIDLTKYVKTDSINLNRVKTYKKINFLYEKSESLVNVGFLSNNGINYGDLLFTTNNDGEEYSIKLPFEDLNFNNLKDKLQVGYALKTDLQKYIPKPIILYDYNPASLTSLTDTDFYFSELDAPSNGTSYDSYKAFGQELLTDGITYSLNFPAQQSTLTNEVVVNSLYQTYYSNYISNIFNYRARLIKVSAILPISVLTSLKLNNRVIIRDKRYIINSFTTDLTTGEASFELLTDLRIL